MQVTTSIAVQEALQSFLLPLLDQNLIETGWLQSVRIEKNAVILVLKTGFALSFTKTIWEKSFQDYLQTKFPEITVVVIQQEGQIKSHAVQSDIPALPGVKNIIAVGSGKGGVGKSTTAVNLALALLQEGARVGLLDADIYGPNQPHFLNSLGRPNIREDKKIIPLLAYGLQTISMGNLIEPETPMIWRGPMISAALSQLLNDTLWENLDYLIVDLPPGTGDIQLTLAKKIPVTGVLLVTTPQDVALLDVRKSLEMFRKTDVHVLGVVENMSQHICSQCGHVEPIFGQGGAERFAKTCEIPFLGMLPLSLPIRIAGDQGEPIVSAHPDSNEAMLYRSLALKVASLISLRKPNYSSKFPKIVVE
jgi:ATP-binding protein involved in chromosome partitioning